MVNVELGKIKDKCNSSSIVVSPLSRSRKGLMDEDEDGYTLVCSETGVKETFSS